MILRTVAKNGWPKMPRMPYPKHGPAFIQAPDWWRHSMADCEKNCGRGVWQHIWFHNNVPEGYVWQKATTGTGAGWIRPHTARENNS